ncbi:MAG TPA: ester cyclase [Ramlibacter sp.]|nr:ester cyclase [Ramlibacter sp.]
MVDLSPEGTVRSYYDALNARDYARAAGPIAESCDWVSMPTEKHFRGPAAVVAGLREFTTSFPDWRVDVEHVISKGDIVVIEWHTSGTFLNPFRGNEPNGRRFSRRGCAVAKVESGRIVHYRDYYDRASLFAQLGLLELFTP